MIFMNHKCNDSNIFLEKFILLFQKFVHALIHQKLNSIKIILVDSNDVNLNSCSWIDLYNLQKSLAILDQQFKKIKFVLIDKLN